MNILCVCGGGDMVNVWIFFGYYHKTELFLGVISILFCRASVKRAYAVYYAQKSAAYAEITHQRRTADF